VMSSRFPIGVPTTYSFPAMLSDYPQTHGNNSFFADGGNPALFGIARTRGFCH